MLIEQIYDSKLGTQQSYPMGILKPKSFKCQKASKVFDAKVWEINPDSEVEKMRRSLALFCRFQVRLRELAKPLSGPRISVSEWLIQLCTNYQPHLPDDCNLKSFSHTEPLPRLAKPVSLGSPVPHIHFPSYWSIAMNAPCWFVRFSRQAFPQWRTSPSKATSPHLSSPLPLTMSQQGQSSFKPPHPGLFPAIYNKTTFLTQMYRIKQIFQVAADLARVSPSGHTWPAGCQFFCPCICPFNIHLSL